MCVLQFLSGIPNPLHFEEIGIKDTLMSDILRMLFMTLTPTSRISCICLYLAC